MTDVPNDDVERQAAGRGGHRVVPHTADVIVEAWGTDAPSCLQEAVAGLIAIYAEPRAATITDRRHVHLPPQPIEDQLLAALESVIFFLDTEPDIPVGAEVRPADDGGLDLTLALADRARVRLTGSGPKAIARSELAVEVGPGETRCRYLVDV